MIHKSEFRSKVLHYRTIWQSSNEAIKKLIPNFTEMLKINIVGMILA